MKRTNRCCKNFSALLILFFLSVHHLLAQVNHKPVIDTSVLGKWPEITQSLISNDGAYAMYIVDNKMENSSALHVLSTFSKWNIEITGVSDNLNFSDNSKYAYFKNDGDSLGIITLGKTSVQYIPNVSYYSLSKNRGQEYLAYLLKDDSSSLVLENLTTFSQTVYTQVRNFLFDRQATKLLLRVGNQKDSIESIVMMDLKTKQKTSIWTGKNIGSYIFNEDGTKLAFIGTPLHESGRSVFYYDDFLKKPICFLSHDAPGINAQWKISGDLLQFSKNGDKILFEMEKSVTALQTNQLDSGVRIWNYRDAYLESDRRKAGFFNLSKNEKILSVLTVNDGSVVHLNKEGEFVLLSNGFQKHFIVNKELDFLTFYDTIHFKPYTAVVSSINGRVELKINKFISYTSELTPDGNYFVWYDPDSLCYFSYDLSLGQKNNLTAGLPFPFIDGIATRTARWVYPYDIAGYGADHTSIFIYDAFDIWKLDLAGMKPPLNITNGYGRKHKIILSVLGADKSVDQNIISLGTYLTGFDSVNKYTGFWKCSERFTDDPIKLSEGPFHYYSRGPAIGDFPTSYVPQKAKYRNMFLVGRTTAADFPNLYVTNDLRKFKQISFLEPEKKYNWLTAELMEWKLPDGNMSQGVLYKPENFDSTKKYPVIFNYYERKSSTLNDYMAPDFQHAVIDIPYYVSNGYLVFLPDIYYQRFHNGRSVERSVVSAAHYLSKFPWVDSTKMGIYGHSFGGWETNFLVTHSNCFAAACEMAGVSDQVSTVAQGDVNFQASYLALSSPGSAYGVEVTPWSNPETFIENSPIFNEGSVTSPLLIIHGTDDTGVPFAQGLEMFLSLRRAGKKVWLLEYDKAGHILFGENARDCTTRTKQFFDYYLKNAPSPVWMTNGIPDSLKLSNNGLQSDYSSAKP
jgi:dienelactone hydrolase